MHNKPHTTEAKRKMSETTKKNPPRHWLGKKFSKEHREKLSLSHLGKKGHWTNKKRPDISQKKHYYWKGGRKKNNVCAYCNKVFYTYDSKQQKYCSRKCYSLALSILLKGENSPNWKGGKSFEPYSTDWTATLRRAIRERDNYICQLCSQYGIAVHHIDYDKKNCNPENLITLCMGCHTKTNHNREYWTNYFCKDYNKIFNN